MVQKRRSDKERRGSYIAAYSLLHSRDGNILYINRSQEPAFLNPKEAEVDIRRYSGKIGELPRIVKMPHRSGFPEGLIAVWGKITLEPLDQESIKVLADGKSPKKGLLIDSSAILYDRQRKVYRSTALTAVQDLYGRQVSIRKDAGLSDWQQ